MPNFTGPSPYDAPSISDAALAAMLAGEQLPPGSAPQLQPVAKTLAELAGQPAEDELDSEADSLIAFRIHFGASGPVRHAARSPRPRWYPQPLPLRAAAALAALLGLGGIATAAYAGALPAGLQRLAHDIIGAPAANAQPTTRPSPALPAATAQPGSAKAHTVPPSSRPTATPSQHSGKPTALPTPHGSGKPTVLPTPHGSGKPTVLPTPHGSGKPTGLPTPQGSGGPSALATPHDAGGRPSGD
jgi:hypothetical protein